MKKISLSIAITCFTISLWAQGIPPRQEVNLDDVYTQYGLSGENVVVVIIDRGIDYRHPDFLDENGNTRLAYVYDMIDQTGAGDPDNPYGIGTIFDQAEIDLALDNNDPPLSTDRGGHGTATTGIAAGNGSGTVSGDFQGVAHGATIISIKITHDAFPPFGSEPGQAGFFDPTFIPVALQFAEDKIAELGLPSITLMNLGSIGGPTDGTSTVCQAIDAFVMAGNTFICGVGDDGGGDNHAATNISQGETIELEIQKAETGFLRLDLWYSEDDRFTISIERPNGTVEGPFAAPAGPNGAVDLSFGDIFMFHRGANVEFFGATSNRRELLIDFTGNTGTYKVILEGAQISNGDFHATLNPSFYSNNNRFLNFVVPGYSINDYASSNLGITPTDYVVQPSWTDINGVPRSITGQGDPGELWIGSSSSPTQDDRLGIDVAVPGEVCHAAYADNTYYESFPGNVLQNSNGLYGIQNAVSAAAPLLTGVIALMLEVNPNLTPEEIRTLIHNSSREDAFTGTVPNHDWGYGKLDALQLIEDTYATLGTEDVTKDASIIAFPNPTQGKLTIATQHLSEEISVTVSNVAGQLLMTHKGQQTQQLELDFNVPRGMYFVTVSTSEGKKTLKVLKD
ncbi:S8 family peptidase [Aureisphaera galaxeae]|uniref:S8 family peptidase n=1 Tax=Aureisphaera galaxeae TaxID=1538023 RepID=UPI002350D0EB|nr:S8 family peptidase [Aureisphaera galaxeae]MDC8002937.1 S8 family peptidase [Aureisphaera galaxeae]